MPERASLPDAGTIVGGKYSITRVIGSGGMGIVYEAIHIKLRQRVAVKMLHPQFAERGDIVVRFEREARAAAQLRSPHVARIVDVDALPDGTPYIVMEFLEGRDLAAELHVRGPMPVAEAVDYVVQACDAMAEAHRVGTVHRDLKPGNLFLANDGRRRIVKVLDFGISKVAGDGTSPSVTSTFSALGTALYMSPEQVRSAKHVDARSDVWALGVVLYELLAGRPPFEGETATAVAAAVVADPATPLSKHRPDVPEQLETAVMTALEKDRNMRFQDASAFAGAIAPFAQSASTYPEQARPAATQPRQLKDAMPLEEEDTVLMPLEASHPAQPPVQPIAIAESAPTPHLSAGPATAATWSQSERGTMLSGSRRNLLFGVGAAVVTIVGISVAIFSGGEEPSASAASSSLEAAPVSPPLPVEAQPSATSEPSSIPVLDLSSGPQSSVSAAPSPVVTPKRNKPPTPTRISESAKPSPKSATTVKAPAKPVVRKGGAGLPDDPG